MKSGTKCAIRAIIHSTETTAGAEIMPNPKIQIDAKQVERLAALGDSFEEIAESLGISVTTLNRRRAEKAELEEAIKRGRRKGLTIVENTLFKMATSGENTAATIFYLKTRAGQKWCERQQVDVTNNQPVRLQIIDDLRE